MPEPLDASASTGLSARLQQLSSFLRALPHISKTQQTELAELVDELGRDIDVAKLSATEQAHLAELIDHFEQALQPQPDRSLTAVVRQRVGEFALRAESKAPITTGIARRLIEVLANLGI